MKPCPAQTDDVGDELRHGDYHLQVNSGESFALTEFKVTSHQQIQQTASLASSGGQTRVATSQDLVAQSAAKQRVAAEEQGREFTNEGSEGSEGVFDDCFALERRVQ